MLKTDKTTEFGPLLGGEEIMPQIVGNVLLAAKDIGSDFPRGGVF